MSLSSIGTLEYIVYSLSKCRNVISLILLYIRERCNTNTNEFTLFGKYQKHIL